jgi:ribosomal RNA-processing protein 9
MITIQFNQQFSLTAHMVHGRMFHLVPAMSAEFLHPATIMLMDGVTLASQVWNQLRKKPLSIIQEAHGQGAVQHHGGSSAGHVYCQLMDKRPSAAAEVTPPSQQASDVTGWVQSVAVCQNSDLVASGASDGAVRLWKVEKNKMGGAQDLSCIGSLPVRGCVNGLAWSRSGKLLVAAVGQEPRLGRWMRDGKAKNGLVVYRLEVRE